MDMHDSFDALEWILVGILIIVVWAGIVVAIKLPRIELLTRGVYEELKRIYDALEHRNRDSINISPLCKSCSKPLAADERFCGACGQPASQAASA